MPAVFMAVFQQSAARLLSLSTPLGENVLLLHAFAGSEEMSRLFRYELELLSEDDALKPADLVGQAVTWAVQAGDDEPRYFNGVVSSFGAGARTFRGLRTYRAEVVPWFWFLTQTADCRIFQNQTVPEIVEAVFAEYGFKDYKPSLRRDYGKWEYCVQYRETAFQFVARLLEHEGIYYYFKHENGKHTLVLGDTPTAYTDCAEKQVRYSAGTLVANHVHQWQRQVTFRPGKRAHTDYNFETPSTPLLALTKSVLKLAGTDRFEMFDYPGEYEAKGDGAAEVRLRMEEDEAVHEIVTGAGRCPSFTPGGKFMLEDHDCDGENGGYVLTAVRHEAHDASFEGNGSVSEYSSTFSCIPDAVAYRPGRVTPKPVVKGPQTAVVVGPKGEEIYTDKYGRIKVQFHWDRRGEWNEDSSCWVRVGTSWAGKGWGSVQIPRIGQEVIVSFLEGDADRPLVTGSVYNAEHMPPNGLPDAKMVSGVKSDSTPGGGGSNSIMLDDTKGKEQIAIHAQYDKNVTVDNDLTTTVHNNRTSTVKVDSTETVVGKKTTMVNGAVLETYNDALSTVVKSDTVLVSTDAHVHVLASTEVMLNSGASTLLLKQDGTIELTGVNITINGKSLVDVGAPKVNVLGGKETLMGVGGQTVLCDGGQVAVCGAEITSAAEGTHNVKGTLVKIN